MEFGIQVGLGKDKRLSLFNLPRIHAVEIPLKHNIELLPATQVSLPIHFVIFQTYCNSGSKNVPTLNTTILRPRSNECEFIPVS